MLALDSFKWNNTHEETTKQDDARLLFRLPLAGFCSPDLPVLCIRSRPSTPASYVHSILFLKRIRASDALPSLYATISLWYARVTVLCK